MRLGARRPPPPSNLILDPRGAGKGEGDNQSSHTPFHPRQAGVGGSNTSNNRSAVDREFLYIEEGTRASGREGNDREITTASLRKHQRRSWRTELIIAIWFRAAAFRELQQKKRGPQAQTLLWAPPPGPVL